MDTEVIIESKSGGNSDRRMTLEEISEIIGISRTTIYKVYQALLKHNLQPVMSDYIYV